MDFRQPYGHSFTSPGLAPGWSPCYPGLSEGQQALDLISSIRVNWITQDQFALDAPDNIAPGIIWACKPLHHIQGGGHCFVEPWFIPSYFHHYSLQNLFLLWHLDSGQENTTTCVQIEPFKTLTSYWKALFFLVCKGNDILSISTAIGRSEKSFFKGLSNVILCMMLNCCLSNN